MAVKKCVYLIDSLTSGGAQRQLVELVRGLDKNYIMPSVVTYHDIPFFRNELLEAGIPYLCIEKKDKIGASFLRDFLRILKQTRPDFIHSFLNVPNIYARVAKLLGGVSAVVTSERNISITQHLDLTIGEKLTWRLSDVIITNAYATKDILVQRIGINAEKIRVVYNGVDVARFTMPSPENVYKIRQACKAQTANTKLIGLVGRIVPQKNHLCLIKAIRLLLSRRPDLDLKVAFWGSTPDAAYIQEVREYLKDSNLEEAFFFLGAESDMASVYSACDIIVLPSLWEGFPNIVLEAMSANRPVIASDIVDNAKIITNDVDGFLTLPDDAENLAHVILKVVNLPEDERKSLCGRGFEKIIREFSTNRMVENTMKVYEEFGLC